MLREEVIIITGARGKIAREFIESYKNTNKVYGLSRVTDEGMIETDYSISSLIKIFKDIKEENKDREIVIIHTASQTPTTKGDANYEESYKIAEAIYKAARKSEIDNVVLLSSMAIYPDKSEIDGIEYNKLKPALNEYGHMKRRVEFLANRYRKSIRTKILRVGNVIFADNSKNKNLLGYFIQQGKEGKNITLYRNAINLGQNYVYVKDLVEIMYNAIGYRDYAIFNVGNKEYVTNKDMAHIVGNYYDVDIFLQDSDTQTKSVRMNTERAERFLDKKKYIEIKDMLDYIE